MGFETLVLSLVTEHWTVSQIIDSRGRHGTSP